MQFKGWVSGVVALCLASPALAQSPTDSVRVGSVGGTVFDSVTMKFVAGATVQMVLKNAPYGTVYYAESDDKGRYEIPNVPPGYYLITFQHAALDSFTVTPPLHAIDVMRGNRTRADVAVPAPPRIIAALCGTTATDTMGVLLGVLRDARTRLPVDSGHLHAAWTDLIVATGGMRLEERSLRAKVVADGLVALCGLAPSGEVVVFATSGADSTGAVLVELPANGLLRREFLIGGRARVSGVVTNGVRPIPNAHVSVGGQDRGTDTDSSGKFRLEVHAGTQTLEVKAIGFVPERYALNLEADRDTVLHVNVTTLKKMMDTIKVIAERLYWRDRGGFAQRKKQGIGHFIDESDIAKHATFDVLDALRLVPSVSIVGFGFFKRVVMRKNDGSSCTPSLFLDGFRMQMGPADLDALSPDEVGGIEVYRSAAEVPPQFTTLDGCGTIVVWTRPPRPRRIR